MNDGAEKFVAWAGPSMASVSIGSALRLVAATAIGAAPIRMTPTAPAAAADPEGVGRVWRLTAPATTRPGPRWRH